MHALLNDNSLNWGCGAIALNVSNLSLYRYLLKDTQSLKNFFFVFHNIDKTLSTFILL